jgi:osmotically-inducible protein OsmY
MSQVSDEGIRGSIVEALARDGRVNAADRVQVRVEDGRASLSGTVRSAAEKEAAGLLAALVPGVVEVVNSLTVFTEGAVPDAQLARAAREALAYASDPVLRSLGVDVRDGVAFIMGTVSSLAQRDDAMRLVSAVKGIESVVSNLSIVPVISGETTLAYDDASVVSFVSGALAEARIDLRDESITSNQGVVTLSGSVGSDEEKQRAQEVARGAPGVRSLRANLTVRLSETSQDPDEALAARVLRAFREDGRVSPLQVKVSVRNGVVTLTGQVDSIDRQNAALEAASRAPGVRRVLNQVIIADRTSAASDDKGNHGRLRM